MGFSPLSGIMMGSRSGDVDPTVLLHIGNISFKGSVHDKWKGVQTVLNYTSIYKAQQIEVRL